MGIGARPRMVDIQKSAVRQAVNAREEHGGADAAA
jgi:hypothetical protein